MIGAHTGLPWPAIYHRRGGGSGPPPIPTTSANFVTGTYRVLSTPILNPSDMFQSDDTDGDPWFPEKIEPGVGYWNDSGEAGASYHGAALAAVTEEFVILLEVNLASLDTNNSSHVLAYDGTFDNTFHASQINDNTNKLEIHDQNVASIQSLLTVVPGINRAAFRFSNNTLALSLNGAAVVSVGGVATPTPVSVVTFYTGGAAGAGCIIRLVNTYSNSLTDVQMQALTVLS